MALPNVSVQGYDKDRRVIHWNHASELLYGYTEEDAIGQRLEDLIIPDGMKEGVVHAHFSWIDQGVPIPPAELELVDKYGTRVPVFSSHVMLYQESDNPEMFCVDVDLSSLRSQERQLDYLLKYDSQTALFNKESLFNYAKITQENDTRKVERYGAIFVGIDDLTHINNTYGYRSGDTLIQDFVGRLHGCVNNRDFVARYSGDTFVILLELADSLNRLDQVVSNLEKASVSPYLINNEAQFVTLSAGICSDKISTTSLTDQIKNAEIAMTQAKLSGKNQCVFYEPQFESKLHRMHTILSSLATAQERNEFNLVYQPQYNQKQQIVSCEALLRWSNKELGTVSPAEFIPLAEKNNKTQSIDRWVIESTVAQLKQWMDTQLNPVRVFVNVSSQSLYDDQFYQFVAETLISSDVPSNLLGIEITEHLLISENKVLLDNLNGLQQQGIEIALDDFGTGYSSLNYLTRLPLNCVKIDKSFINNAPENPRDAAIIRAIFALSKSLDLNVVCEGVEDREQLRFIQRENRRSFLQGYLLSMPVAADKLEQLLMVEPESYQPISI